VHKPISSCDLSAPLATPRLYLHLTSKRTCLNRASLHHLASTLGRPQITPASTSCIPIRARVSTRPEAHVILFHNPAPIFEPSLVLIRQFCLDCWEGSNRLVPGCISEHEMSMQKRAYHCDFQLTPHVNPVPDQLMPSVYNLFGIHACESASLGVIPPEGQD
jgi:hypothetical protein